MREIVSVQVGQCGNQVGSSFWQTISQDHSILPSGQYIGDSDQQLEMIDTYFDQSSEGTFVPRTVLLDLDPKTLESIRQGDIGHLFRHDNFVQGEYGAGNDWGTGHYTDGADIIDFGLDVVRR
jgi:tubulin beta